jgi:hypothetical protein
MHSYSYRPIMHQNEYINIIYRIPKMFRRFIQHLSIAQEIWKCIRNRETVNLSSVPCLKIHGYLLKLFL